MTLRIPKLLSLALLLALPAVTWAASPGSSARVQEAEGIYARAEALLASGHFEKAAAEALKLSQTGLWREGDAAVAGMLRALADGLQARGQQPLARRLLDAGAPAGQPSANFSLVLQGRSLEPFLNLASAHPRSWRAVQGVGHAFRGDADLKRVFVGHQAGVLKIVGEEKPQRVLFIKDIPGTDIWGIDGRLWAPLDDHHRQAIYAALGIDPGDLDAAVAGLIRGYGKSTRKLQTLAVLGAIGSTPGPEVSAATRQELLAFLSNELDRGRDVALRRQSLLALALLHQIEGSTVHRVVDFYDRTWNVWEAFPVVQFFEYHSDYISALPDSRQIRDRLAGMESLYTPYVIEHIHPQ